jgi:hypothetical protein
VRLSVWLSQTGFGSEYVFLKEDSYEEACDGGHKAEARSKYE